MLRSKCFGQNTRSRLRCPNPRPYTMPISPKRFESMKFAAFQIFNGSALLEASPSLFGAEEFRQRVFSRVP